MNNTAAQNLKTGDKVGTRTVISVRTFGGSTDVTLRTGNNYGTQISRRYAADKIVEVG